MSFFLQDTSDPQSLEWESIWTWGYLDSIETVFDTDLITTTGTDICNWKDRRTKTDREAFRGASTEGQIIDKIKYELTLETILIFKKVHLF